MTDYSSHDYEAAADTLNAFRIAICAVGLFGNFILLCTIFLSGDFKRGGIHWYVLQLAIADSLFLGTLPLRVVQTNEGWIYSEGVCKMKNGLVYVNYYNSLLFLTVMALDRYFAICHSFSDRFSVLKTHRASYVVTAIIWLISICMAFPVALYSRTSMGDKCVCEIKFPTDYHKFCISEGFEGEMIEQCAIALSTTSNQGCSESNAYDYDDYSGSGSDSGSSNETEILNTVASSINETSEISSTALVFPSSKAPESITLFRFINETPSELTSTPTTAAQSQKDNVVFQPGCSYANYEAGYRAFLIFNFAVMFFVPFVIMTACYTLIVMKVRKSRFKQFKEERSISGAHRQEAKTKRRVTIMCFMLVVVFAICWLPYNAQEMAKMQGIHETEKFCRNIKLATSIMIFANSAVNPYIYLFGAGFKKKLKRMRESRAGSAVYSFITLSTIFRRESASSVSRGDEKRLTGEKSTNRVSEVDEKSPINAEQA